MTFRGLLLPALLFSAAFASADTFTDTLTFNNAESWDGLYDPDNLDVTFDLGVLYPTYTNFSLIGIGWDIDVETVGISWLSDLIVSVEASSAELLGGDYVDTNPTTGDDFSGTGSYSSGGIITLGAPVVFEPDNLMRVHLWELVDDDPDGIDAIVNGTYTLQFEATPRAVPEPATLAALGLGTLALLRKRRR